jgi:hypothetical protein
MRWLLKSLKMSSVEYWEMKLKITQGPQDYAPFLLSRIDEFDKARLIYRISLQKGLPDHPFGHQGRTTGNTPVSKGAKTIRASCSLLSVPHTAF